MALKKILLKMEKVVLMVLRKVIGRKRLMLIQHIWF